FQHLKKARRQWLQERIESPDGHRSRSRARSTAGVPGPRRGTDTPREEYNLLSPHVMALEAGTRLGPYEIMSPLGAGGMGEVYKAHDGRLGRTVAVKVLLDAAAADPSFRARFEREARAIAALSHPHICAIYDVGRNGTDTGPAVDFIVMEYLEG